MLRASDLSLNESSILFNEGGHHVAVNLCRLPGARVVWINQRVMNDDLAFEACGGTVKAYAEHLLHSCGYVISANDGCGDSVSGVADRYGGTGIGYNGGSGRAAIINGYLVKGIGRTPLVSALTDEAHASGGAYLEECIREAIFSELVAAEFPGGAVPILAIIDTGEVQLWNTDTGPIPERRCLLIRPVFLRPAHFERAPGYISAHPKEGHRDSLRVRHVFNTALHLWGREALQASYKTFWLTWAEQLAYAFIHRLPHGGDSTSNIALDGKLLDFGAMTAIPSWARVSTIMGSLPSGENLIHLIKAIQTHVMFWARYVTAETLRPDSANELVTLAVQHYQHAVVREVLRVAGLTKRQAQKLIISAHQEALMSIVARLLTHYRREQLAVFNNMPMPMPRLAWDIAQVWSETPPNHLLALRTFLVNRVCRVDAAVMRTLSARCTMRSRGREALYRDRIKVDLYRILESNLKGHALKQESLDRVISEWVCQNRRDSSIEFDDALPIGFARHTTASYALFQEQSSGRRFAVNEWSVEGVSPAGLQRISIESIAGDRIVFANPSIKPFQGAVMLI
jgi:hypothetical protein